eukprot:3377103-Amphidinium_carterae.1
MTQDRLRRGYFPSFPMSPKGKGGKGKGKPTWFSGKGGTGMYRGKGYMKGDTKGKTSGSGGKQSRLQQIISRTKCNKCGQIGHWQKECPLNRAAGSLPSSSTPRNMASFFICHSNDE